MPGNEQVRDVFRKMQADYIAGLPRKLAAINELIMEWHRRDDCGHSLENLHRAVHSLRGTAGTYGIPSISAICQPFEEYLESAGRDGTGCSRRQVKDCLSFLDLLENASRLLASGSGSFTEIDPAMLARR